VKSACGHRYRTDSDTETIVHLYEQYGRNCIEHLRGMFAFAIWDTRQRRLFAARDRLGIKPFYYHCAPECLLFASEIKAIFAYQETTPSFMDRALLGPAPTGEDATHTETHYIQTYRDLLEQAVSSHLMSDVPVGVFLSGESIPAPWQPR